MNKHMPHCHRVQLRTKPNNYFGEPKPKQTKRSIMMDAQNKTLSSSFILTLIDHLGEKAMIACIPNEFGPNPPQGTNFPF